MGAQSPPVGRPTCGDPQGVPPPSLSAFFSPLSPLVLPDLAVMLSVSVSIMTIEH